jgi:hypothetical protein
MIEPNLENSAETEPIPCRIVYIVRSIERESETRVLASQEELSGSPAAEMRRGLPL